MAEKRILIIDDEQAIQAVASLSLKMEADWQVITANSGAEGIAIAGQEQPDAILLDVMMPMLDGIETFKQLQQGPLTRSIPVILLTAKAQAAEQQQFQSLGVAGVITKPFNSLTLASQIAQVLGWVL
ncbi:response regulator [Acaryochloris marina]|uniref:Response regulator n=1 Tax=Acaryochloris marina (strain MBIC 11017) TaxID=329726 RepID=B0BYI7_ACAM1|nr:response regulator [Acaryochloris marina]ABW25872.1 response regulator [Acaryochloris marina MBIC11017]BDM80732.1 response regulator [Acaryochloris marina MBIC10699]